MKNIFRKPWFAFILGILCSIVVAAGFVIYLQFNAQIPTVGEESDQQLETEEQTVYDENQVQIKVLGFNKESFTGEEIMLEIKNDTDERYYISTDMMSVNSIMTSSIVTSNIVEPQTTRFASVTLDTFMNPQGLYPIHQVLFNLTLSPNQDPGAEDDKKIVVNDIDIKTNYYGQELPAVPEPQGKIVTEYDNMVVTHLDNPPLGEDSSIHLYIENNSDQDRFFYSNNFVVGNQDINPFINVYIPVRAHSKVLDSNSPIMLPELVNSTLGDNKLYSTVGIFDYKTRELTTDGQVYTWN